MSTSTDNTAAVPIKVLPTPHIVFINPDGSIGVAVESNYKAQEEERTRYLVEAEARRRQEFFAARAQVIQENNLRAPALSVAATGYLRRKRGLLMLIALDFIFVILQLLLIRVSLTGGGTEDEHPYDTRFALLVLDLLADAFGLAFLRKNMLRVIDVFIVAQAILLIVSLFFVLSPALALRAILIVLAYQLRKLLVAFQSSLAALPIAMPVFSAAPMPPILHVDVSRSAVNLSDRDSQDRSSLSLEANADARHSRLNFDSPRLGEVNEENHPAAATRSAHAQVSSIE